MSVTADPIRAMQAVFEKRGYLVISALHRERIGAVVTGVDVSFDRYKYDKRDEIKFVITAETDEADHIQQCAMAGHVRWANDFDKCYYYRVVAE